MRPHGTGSRARGADAAPRQTPAAGGQPDRFAALQLNRRPLLASNPRAPVGGGRDLELVAVSAGARRPRLTAAMAGCAGEPVRSDRALQDRLLALLEERGRPACWCSTGLRGRRFAVLRSWLQGLAAGPATAGRPRADRRFAALKAHRRGGPTLGADGSGPDSIGHRMRPLVVNSAGSYGLQINGARQGACWAGSAATAPCARSPRSAIS